MKYEAEVFHFDVAYLIQFARQRPDFVRAALGALPQ
jgi:hypothetical protein